MNFLHKILGAPLPTDPLERALVRFATGAIPKDEFLAELSSAQVYVLLEGGPNAAPLEPLAVSTPEGYSVVCVFTGPELAIEMLRQHPACPAVMAVDSAWVLANLPAAHGLVVNPGHAACLFLAPESADSLRGEVLKAA